MRKVDCEHAEVKAQRPDDSGGRALWQGRESIKFKAEFGNMVDRV